MTIVLGATAADSNVVFTLGTSDVKTTIKRVKTDGDSVEIAYEFDVQGNLLTSTLSGKREGSKLDGKYRTVVSGGDDQVDNGTFSATE